ncbi:hypothetical protein R3W88_031814 [Solanum pinnatisectum]|uniref:Uncharacterized protein n=1 Tax=Solanum pinnatisectum TaxID=50273 RepID=A0AAV9LRA2_9SOLN|nr:hypothetical protein R3W88_031814 [Solanum pinnatisectum]
MMNTHFSNVSLVQQPPTWCEICEGGDHNAEVCGANPDSGIPRYAKYVKEIVANKNKLTEYETVAHTEECSSRIQNKLPNKLKDPGSFTVQITIGQSIHARRLCDLGASINLMPTSLYKILGLGSPKPTTIILQLADQSVARPEGVVEDVLVQVGSLIFPVDFVVLKFEPDPEFHSSWENLSWLEGVL